MNIPMNERSNTQFDRRQHAEAPERPHRGSHLAFAALRVVATAGIIAVALVAPNAVQALRLVMPGASRRREYYPCHMKAVIERLRRRHLIQLVKKDRKAYYQVTEQGQEVLARYVLQETAMPRPKRWDKKWRLLLFDIAETRKPTRENIRRSLQRLGLTRLQDSVWLYPYACEEVMELLRTAYGVRHDALYITTERFLGDHDFLVTYGLTEYSDHI